MRAARITKTLFALAAIAVATGCAVKRDFYAMGGSRADGTVDMAYDFRQFEKPVVNQQQALSIAKSKCGVWGYGDAEAFGGTTQNCHQRDGWGNCVAGQAIIKYQCLSSPEFAAPAPASAAPSSALPAGMMAPDQYRQNQLDQLQRQNLSYEEYQKRYRQIMGE